MISLLSMHVCRFGCSCGSYSLVMKACSQYWNTCLPLAASPFGRDLLCGPVLELLSLVATFLGRGKHEPSGKHQDTLLAMYGLAFQALSDKVIYILRPTWYSYSLQRKASYTACKFSLIKTRKHSESLGMRLVIRSMQFIHTSNQVFSCCCVY